MPAMSVFMLISKFICLTLKNVNQISPLKDDKVFAMMLRCFGFCIQASDLYDKLSTEHLKELSQPDDRKQWQKIWVWPVLQCMMGNSTHQRTYVIEVHTVSWVFFTIQYLYKNKWNFPYLYTCNTYMYLVYTVT